jgi:hypothetical protein
MPGSPNLKRKTGIAPRCSLSSPVSQVLSPEGIGRPIIYLSGLPPGADGSPLNAGIHDLSPCKPGSYDGCPPHW